MKKIIICFLTLQFILIACSSEVKKSDIYSVINKDPLFQEYLKRFKMDNKIFSDQSIYFDKVKKKKYFKCYGELFPSKSCDFKDHKGCQDLENDSEFLAVVENKCKKGKLLTEIKEKYPEMDKKVLAKLLNDSYEDGLAAEVLKNRKTNKNEK